MFICRDHGDGVLCLLLTMADDYVITGSRDCYFRVISLDTGQVVHSKKEHTGPVTCLSLNAKNTILLTGTLSRVFKGRYCALSNMSTVYRLCSVPLCLVHIHGGATLSCTHTRWRHSILYTYTVAPLYLVLIHDCATLSCTRTRWHHFILYTYTVAPLYLVHIRVGATLSCTHTRWRHSILYTYTLAPLYLLHIHDCATLSCTHTRWRHSILYTYALAPLYHVHICVGATLSYTRWRHSTRRISSNNNRHKWFSCLRNAESGQPFISGRKMNSIAMILPQGHVHNTTQYQTYLKAISQSTTASRASNQIPRQPSINMRVTASACHV